MPEHEYSARGALELLQRRIEESSPALAERIRIAIDTGKDVLLEDEESPRGRGRKKLPRYYRKNQPFTDEEALAVALGVLEAHLVETRMFANSAREEFASSAIAGPKPPIDGKEAHQTAEGTRREPGITIEIEIESETVQAKRQTENEVLITESASEISSLCAVFAELRELTSFGDSTRGHAG